jgi:hypothetical protein
MSTAVASPLVEPSLTSRGNPSIEQSVCLQHGHEYVNTCTEFKRDKHGNPFTGVGQQSAARYQVWVCRKCGGTTEVKITPKLDVRQPKPSAPTSK